MSKPLLIIDAGHGGKDPGGGSSIFYVPRGFYEKDIVLDISLYQYRRLRDLGVNVALTRDADVYLSPADRTKIIRKSGAKYCVSNHINAAGNASARGVETIHSVKSNGKLARAIYDAIVAEGIAGRRVFTRTLADGRDYYFMHRDTGAVSTVIVEYGFATNAGDAELLAQNWERYAEAVVRAFCEFVGHPYSPPEAPTPADSLPQVTGTVSVLINGADIGTGYLIDGRTYVPLRAIGEALGMRVGWNQADKIASLEGGK